MSGKIRGCWNAASCSLIGTASWLRRSWCAVCRKIAASPTSCPVGNSGKSWKATLSFPPILPHEMVYFQFPLGGFAIAGSGCGSLCWLCHHRIGQHVGAALEFPARLGKRLAQLHVQPIPVADSGASLLANRSL